MAGSIPLALTMKPLNVSYLLILGEEVDYGRHGSQYRSYR
jgi:hypothetical protein